jgi:hypothetical protein
MTEKNGLQNDTALGVNMDFYDELAEKFPRMYGEHGDVWVDKGWRPIIFALSSCIQSHLDWVNRDGENVAQVVVAQVKEKFGGLRFYYDGGDEYVDGLVSMAEMWAERTCEVCGG